MYVLNEYTEFGVDIPHITTYNFKLVFHLLFSTIYSKGINSNLILWHNVWSCYGAKPDKLETKNVDGAYKEFRCPTFDHLEYLC